MPPSNVPITVSPLSKEFERQAFGRDICFHDGRSELCEMKDET